LTLAWLHTEMVYPPEGGHPPSTNRAQRTSCNERRYHYDKRPTKSSPPTSMLRVPKRRSSSHD